ncbi:cytochrome P450 [Chaetomium fimeti]|uniref:Cytochrome P450 n=1 Tax=Chaetomium fimeti TaxID=1854472 RepID=A0AAE0HAR4_9PEZI|nr:cytochrome P450 [Chaetomium fimeti]
MLSLLPIWLPAVVVVGVLYSWFRSWYRLRDFKGPWLAGLSEAWLFGVTTTGELHMRLYEASQKYGDDFVRIGPNWLMTSDPDVIRHMNAAKYKHQKSSWYEALKVDPYVHSVFSETSVTKHDQLRVKMASGYSLKENRDLGVKIDAEIASLVDLLERKYVSTADDVRPLDMAGAAQFWSLDVITSIALGEPFGYLTEDKDMYDFIKIIQGELPLATLCSSTPTLGNLVFGSGLVKLIGPSPKDEKGRGKLMGIAKRVVGDRYGANKVVRDDMLGTFVRNGLDKRQAESEILTTILAGSDTTATAVRATMLYIMTNPRVYNKLVEEIAAAERNGSISSPITSAESRQMPYVQAVIKEGLRIHPPITGLLTKLVNPGGETIKGRFIPGGTGIGQCGWGIQRHPIFGEDVDVFRPERWIEASEAQRSEMEKTMELVFGTGRWGCLGKTIVLVELDKIFVELLRKFDFELMYPGSAWKTRNFTLFMQKEMWVRVTKREVASS